MEINAWKIFRPKRDSNPWLLRYWRSALPTELSSHWGRVPLDCEKSLFASKIRDGERKTSKRVSVTWRSRYKRLAASPSRPHLCLRFSPQFSRKRETGYSLRPIRIESRWNPVIFLLLRWRQTAQNGRTRHDYPRSHMTWLPVTLSVFTWLLYNL